MDMDSVAISYIQINIMRLHHQEGNLPQVLLMLCVRHSTHLVNRLTITFFLSQVVSLFSPSHSPRAEPRDWVDMNDASTLSRSVLNADSCGLDNANEFCRTFAIFLLIYRHPLSMERFK